MQKSDEILIFIPSIEDGGVEKNLFIIANYLVKKGLKISIITYSNLHKKKFDKKINYISFNTKLKLKLGRKTKYLLCFYLLFLKLVKSNFSSIKIFSFQANLYCILFAKLFKLKIAIRSNSSPSGWSKNFFKKKIYEFFLSKADLIIVNSIEFKSEMKKFFNLKCVCIYNPLNKKEIIKKANINNISYSKKKFRLINVGRLVDQKDQITILKAIRLLKNKIKNIELLILGKGEKYTELKNYIKLHNINQYVKLVGYKKNPYPFIKASNIFILSSKFEGLPNVLLESQCLKKIIISTNCPTGPKEILNNGEYGELFNIKDYKKLSQIIENVYFNFKFFSKKAHAGYKNLYKYNFNENLHKYYKTINQI